MGKINWDDVAALESIANQCINKGKEVGQARAALKAIYGYNVTYSDELDDNDCVKERDKPDENDHARYQP
ncbi:MAG: hypothetical protein V4506_06195 [Bacteroidota bacterium]